MRSPVEQRIFGGIDRTAPRDSLPDGALWDAKGVLYKTPGRLHGIAEGDESVARAFPRTIPAVTQGSGVSQRPGALFVADVLASSEMTPLAVIGSPPDPAWEPFALSAGPTQGRMYSAWCRGWNGTGDDGGLNDRHRVYFAGGRYYSAGASPGDYPATTAVWVYDLSTDTFTNLPSLPKTGTGISAGRTAQGYHGGILMRVYFDATRVDLYYFGGGYYWNSGANSSLFTGMYRIRCTSGVFDSAWSVQDVAGDGPFDRNGYAERLNAAVLQVIKTPASPPASLSEFVPTSFIAGGRLTGGVDTDEILRVQFPWLDGASAGRMVKIGTLPASMSGGTLQRHPTDAASLIYAGGYISGVPSEKVYKLTAASESALFTGTSASTLTVTEIGTDQIAGGMAYASGIWPEAGGLSGMPTFSEAASRRAVLVGGLGASASPITDPYSVNGSVIANDAEFVAGNEAFHRLYWTFYGGSPIFEYDGYLYQLFGNHGGSTPVRAQRVAL